MPPLPFFRITSFRTLSLLVCPQNHRNIRISATLSCWTCHLFVGQHSAPYYPENYVCLCLIFFENWPLFNFLFDLLVDLCVCACVYFPSLLLNLSSTFIIQLMHGSPFLYKLTPRPFALYYLFFLLTEPMQASTSLLLLV